MSKRKATSDEEGRDFARRVLVARVLEKAFRGKLVPQVPDDEPATILLGRIKSERASGRPVRRRRPSLHTEATT